jgi:hypothetical protein
LILEHHGLAGRRIQHPTRHYDSQLVFELHDDSRFLPRPKPANDLYLMVEKRVKLISDPSWTELMSSVLIP